MAQVEGTWRHTMVALDRVFDMVFNKVSLDETKMFDLIQLRSYYWIKERVEGSTFSFSDWVMNPVA